MGKCRIFTEIASGNEENTERVEKQSEMSTYITELIDKVVSNTEIAKSTTETSIKELGKSKKLMGELKEQSSQIINATIESARAGEAGKCY